MNSNMFSNKEEEEEEEYLLKWGEHNNQVVNIFHQLCQENLLTDVTLATETKQFKAHKLILSACSPYFRNLFVSNPCKHPTVFFKDISEDQMKLLMEYMYKGKISVKQSELESVLRTATSLQIHGLTTPTESPRSESDSQREETSSTHSSTSVDSGGSKRRADGRKSSKPKKLRLNSVEEKEDVVASPIYSMMSPRFPVSEKESSPEQECENILEPHLNTASSDDIAASDDENELVIDQPVDFSTAKPAEQKSKIKTKSLESLKMSAPVMGTWEEQLANLAKAAQKTKEDKEGEEENKDPGQASRSTVGLDIAAQLKSHFLASLPSQSYAWLNGLAAGVPPNTPNTSHADKVKAERTPLGGIKTGEIGPNGKPSVECEDCGKVLADPSSLYRHRKIHTGEKPHKCPYCDKRFIQRYNMKQHIKTHRLDPEEMQKNSINIDLTPKPESLNPLKLSMPSFLAESGLNMTH